MIGGSIDAGNEVEHEQALFVDGAHVDIPDAHTMFRGDYAKDGQDLTISYGDGETLRVVDYFSAAFPPDLIAPNGAQLRGSTVTRLAGAGDDTRLAQASTDGGGVSAQDLANAIGQVEIIQGTVTVTRADGSVVSLGNGDLVFQNDVVATAADSTVSLTFVDGTIFSLSAGSRMLLDELIYDPDGSGNSAVFNLIEGGFVFIAGQVAPTGDMRVETPTGVLGVRGTTVEVQILTDGGNVEVLVALLVDSDGNIGRIDLFDLNEQPIATITDTETGWILSSVEGETRPIPLAEVRQIIDDTLESQTRLAETQANDRVDGGGTFVSQDRTLGGGGDDADPQEEEEDGETPQPEEGPTSGGGGSGGGTGEPGVPGDTLQQEAPDLDTQPGGTPGTPDSGSSPGGDQAPGGDQEGNLQNAPAPDTDVAQNGVAGTPNVQLADGGAIERNQNDQTGPAVTGGLANLQGVTLGDGGIAPAATDNANAATGPQAFDAASQDVEGTQGGDAASEGFEPAAAGLGSPDTPATGAGPTSFASPLAFADTGELGVTNDGATQFGNLADFGDIGTPNDPTGPGGADGGTTPVGSSFAAGSFTDPPETQADTTSPAAPSDSSDPPPNLAPVATGGTVTLFADQSGRAGQLPATDPEEGALTFAIVEQPENGTVDVDRDTGVFEFTPDQGFIGAYVFTYQVTDENGNVSDPGELTINFNETNLAPVAGTDTTTGIEDGAIIINLLANDSDPENGQLSIQSVGAADNGQVTLNDDGTVTYRPDADFNGSDSFTYVLADDAGGSSTGTVNIDVTSVNDRPVVGADTATATEDSSVNIGVLANDIDADGDVLSVASVGTPANGSTQIEADGSVTYTPNADFFGTDSFAYVVSDGAGGTTAGTVAVTVTGQNDAPVATADSVQTAEDQTVVFNVLSNDSDVENDTLSVLSLGAASNGTAVLGAGGQVTYTPDADFNGQDSFSYVLSDGEFQVTGTAIVTVTAVNDPPIAGPDAATTDEDTSVNIAILSNDADPEGGTLEVAALGNPANGSVVQEADGTVTYTPDAEISETDTLTQPLADGAGGTATGTVQVTVVEINDAPVTTDDAATTTEETPVSIAVLSNDIDPEGSALTITNVSEPANGSVQINGDGTLSYTPDAQFNGQDSFTYTVSDADGGTATAGVIVTVSRVNDAPVAADDAATVGEDGSVLVDVIANDTDADGDALTIDSVGAPTNGTAVIGTGGQILYTPDQDFNGADSFTYVVADGFGGFDTATVSITVTPEPDAPVATEDFAATSEDTTVNIDALANDFDVDGETLAILSVGSAANGEAVLLANGTIDYTPDANFTGQDTFTYTVEDSTGSTTVGLVTVTVGGVNDPPVAQADSANTLEDTAVNIDVLANDFDPDDDTLSYVSLGTPANGSAAIQDDGTVTYTPDANFSGTDSFTYSISDGSGGTATSIVTVTVTAQNDPPVATPDAAQTTEDQAVSFNLLTNDTDIEDDPLSVLSIGQAANGTAVLGAGGQVTYTPDENFNGQDSFTYVLSDGDQQVIGTAIVTVNAVNDDPVAVADTATTDEDQSVSIAVLSNDSDAEGAALSVASVGTPANGSAVIETDGTVTYTPDADFSGTDSFTYVVSDGEGGTATGTVAVTIAAQNDAPAATPDTVTVDQDQQVNINVLANDTDIDQDQLSVQSVGDPTSGATFLETDGTVTYTPDEGFVGTDSFTYVLTDGTAQTTGSVFVTVGAVDQPPVVEDDLASTDEGVPVTIDVLANDNDPEGGPLIIEAFGAASNGSVSFGPGDTLIYTPDSGFSGVDSFSYLVIDDPGQATSGIVTVTVNDVPLVATNDADSTLEDNAVEIDVLANDTGPSDRTLTATLLGAPANGSVQVLQNGNLLYTPDANFNGTDSFTYTLSDGVSPTTSGQVDVTITPQADPVTIDVVSQDDVLDVADQLNPVVISGIAEAGGTVQVTFGSEVTTVSAGTDGSYSAQFGPETIPDANSVAILVEATDAQGNTGNSATRSVSVEQSGNLLTITSAGSVSSFNTPPTPVVLDISTMPYDALFVDNGSGVLVDRAPNAGTTSSTQVQFIADDGRTFTLIGTGLDYSTGQGIVSGYQIGTPTDPDYYSADGLQTPLATVRQIFADSLVNGSVDTAPLDNFLGSFAVDFTGSAESDYLSFEEFGSFGNVFRGLGGDDEFRGGAGDDQYFGGEGIDFLQDAEGSNLFDGGADFDIVSYQNAQGGITANLNTGRTTRSDGLVDTLVGIEQVRGSNFADSITLLDAQDEGSVAQSLAGNDTIIGGGAGTFNFVDYSRESRFTARTTGVVVNLATGIATDLFGDQDQLINIQGVFGTEFGDELTGLDAGNSFMSGGGGNDRYISGDGSDAFVLGDGNDTVIYTGGQDDIQGFNFADDTLEFAGDALTFVSSLQVLDISAGQIQRVFFSFTDDQGAGFGITVSDLTLAQADQILDGLGLGGGDIIVDNSQTNISGSPGDDNFLIQPGLAPEQNGFNDRFFTASGGDDTHDFTQNTFRNYNQIDYSALTSGPILANIDLNTVNSTISKGTAGTDTLVNPQLTANWGMGVNGTSGNDTLDLTQNTSEFSFVFFDGSGGDDTIRLIGGGNGILSLRMENSGDVQADLSNLTVSASNGDSYAFTPDSDLTNARIELRTGDGNDNIIGTANDDRFILGAGNDVVDGGLGKDIVRFDRLDVSAGTTVDLQQETADVEWNGTLFTQTLISIEEIRGSRFGDTLTAADTGSILFGEGGNDSLIGGLGKDDLFGGDGDDFIDTSAGTLADAVDGFGDYVRPGLGTDTIIGNSNLWNNDESIDLSYADIEAGFGGVEITAQANGSGGVTGVGGGTAGINDNYTFVNFYEGSLGNDVFRGSDGGGFESFAPIAGADTIIGGSSFLQVFYRNENNYTGTTNGIAANLADGEIIDTAGNIDVVSGISRVQGTNFDDVLSAEGTTQNYSLQGEAGDDRVISGGGDDNFRLGDGFDTLVFNAGEDFVGDFNVAEDTLEVTGAALANFGTLEISDFNSGFGQFVGFNVDGTDFFGIGFEGLTVEQVYQVLAPTFDTFTTGVTIAESAGEGDVLGSPGDDNITLLGRVTGNESYRASVGDDTIGFSPNSFNNFHTLSYRPLGSVDADFSLDARAGQTSTVTKGLSASLGTDTINDLNIAISEGINFFLPTGDTTVDVRFSGTGNDFIGLINNGGQTTVDVFAEEGTLSLELGFDSDVTADIGQRFMSAANGDRIDLNVSGVETDMTYQITTGNGNDSVVGSDTRDRFVVRAGNDTVDGGAGLDTIRYNWSGFTQGVSVNLAAATVLVTGVYEGRAFSHELRSIEGVRGSQFDDTIIGTDSDGDFRGNNGNDSITTGTGDDFVELGAGADTLVFTGGDDFVEDFDVVDDTLIFDRDATANIRTLEFRDGSFDGNQRLNMNFGDDPNEFTLRFKDLTVEDGIRLVNAMNLSGAAITEAGTAGFDILQGTPGDDVITLTETASIDRINASLGNDTLVLPVEGYQNGLELDYRSLGSIGISATIDIAQNQAAIVKGPAALAGTDTIDDPLSAAGPEILQFNSSRGTDDVLLVQSAVDFSTLAVSNFEGRGVTNVTLEAGIGSIRLNQFGPDVVADFSFDPTQGTMTSSDGSAINLTIVGDASNVEFNIRTGDGDDSVIGSARDEVFILGPGTDTLDGGGGFDTIRYNRFDISDPVFVDLENNIATGVQAGAAFNHTLFNIGRVRGSDQDDTMTASNSGSELSGNGGNDSLVGLGGDDYLRGGSGVDTLEGGAGDDSLVFDFDSGSQLSGGTGRDTLIFEDAGSFDFSGVNIATDYQGLEVISLENGVGFDALTLTAADLLDFAQSADTLLNTAFGQALTVIGDTNDELITTQGDNYTFVGTSNDGDGRDLNVYEYSEGAGILAIVAVDQDVTVTPVA